MEWKKQKQFALSTLVSAVVRYPFWDAFSTMMLFAEIESTQAKQIGLPKLIVFADAGILIFLGTFMSFKEGTRRTCALLAAVQVLLQVLLHYDIHGYMEKEVLLHNTLRQVGVAATYILLGSGVGGNRAKRTSIIQFSLFIFALLFSAQTLLLTTSDFERKFALYFLPSQIKTSIVGGLALPMFIICLGLTAFMFASQAKGIMQAKKFALLFWLCLCLPGDIYAKAWANNIASWAVYRLIGATLCTLSGLGILCLVD